MIDWFIDLLIYWLIDWLIDLSIFLQFIYLSIYMNFVSVLTRSLLRVDYIVVIFLLFFSNQIGEAGRFVYADLGIEDQSPLRGL